MPIQSEDIKLLKSAVMADVPEGGGAMTGIEVIDGQSNNLFPDTSAVDRAFGVFQTRKLFGVAHSDDAETLLGAHAIITRPPEDPLVHCTLMESPSWASVRTDVIERVERYAVKGPRYQSRVMDTHYAGSLQLRLYQADGTDFPGGGDAICLRNPNGTEQYVRVIKVTVSQARYNVSENSTVVSAAFNVAVCDLASELEIDVIGAPIARVTADPAAIVYSTTNASGAQFYGIKGLAVAAAPDDLVVQVDGGIFTPLVPAATVESPMIDIQPLLERATLSRTAAASVQFVAVGVVLAAGTVLRAPWPIEPGSVALTHGATLFSDDGAGNLRQGSTVVGTVEYRAGTMTMAAGAPSYGWQQISLLVKPASVTGAVTHSASRTITSANQGLAWVEAFEPPPALGTYRVDYMAQGRWYQLADGGTGKLAGADPSLGVGTVNPTSGSTSVTLGALPDVGSDIIHSWAEAASTQAVPAAGLPGRLSATLQIDWRARPGATTLAWSRAGVNYAATLGLDGVLTGAAQGRLGGSSAAGTQDLAFEPGVFPDGPVVVEWDAAPDRSSHATHNGGGSYTLDKVPVAPGSVRFPVLTVPQAGYIYANALNVADDGAGVLRVTTSGGLGAAWGPAIGSVDYATGAVNVAESVSLSVVELVTQSYAVGSNELFYEAQVPRASHLVMLYNATILTMEHQSAGPASHDTAAVTPTGWHAQIALPAGGRLLPDGLAFVVGGAGGRAYTARAGALVTDWSTVTGAGTAAGAVDDGGRVSLSSVPAVATNAIAWQNAACDSGATRVAQGVFRIAEAPIKAGVLQLQSGDLIANASAAGVLSGDGFAGTVDFQRGIVRWSRVVAGGGGPGAWPWDQFDLAAIPAESLTYNAVALQYLPLDPDLIKVGTARLPLDGKVPIYRPGVAVVVHHTKTTALPNPLTKGVAYDLGRERLATVRVKDSAGTRVPATRYETDLDAGEITIKPDADLSGFVEPLRVEDRIEDMVVVSQADISGRLTLVSGLSHHFPLGSYVSSALMMGDLFARGHGFFEQATWLNKWTDTAEGAAVLWSYNDASYPLIVTNRGTITERWAIIFNTVATAYRVIGEHVGQIAVGDINADLSPINPEVGVPFFTLRAIGFGSGQAAGHVLRFNTVACGDALQVNRTVLQGPPSVLSDVFELGFRGDVDA